VGNGALGAVPISGIVGWEKPADRTFVRSAGFTHRRAVELMGFATFRAASGALRSDAADFDGIL